MFTSIQGDENFVGFRSGVPFPVNQFLRVNRHGKLSQEQGLIQRATNYRNISTNLYNNDPTK